MPTIQCYECATPFALSIEYNNYEGNVRCPECGVLQFVIIDGGTIKQQRLPEIITDREAIIKIPEAPESINNDLREAQLCSSVEAYKGCVVLCRRTLEQLCGDIGATGRTLFEKINYLHKNGYISQRELTLYNEIRYFGNYGAHPSDDLLGEVTKDDSDLVLEVTLHLVKHVYEMPEKIRKLEERRKRTT